ncbi:MAG: hypothetical protein ACK4FF_13595 [Limnobacter sp.]
MSEPVLRKVALCCLLPAAFAAYRVRMHGRFRYPDFGQWRSARRERQ